MLFVYWKSSLPPCDSQCLFMGSDFYQIGCQANKLKTKVVLTIKKSADPGSKQPKY